MKASIVIFAETLSDNLGDGVIGACEKFVFDSLIDDVFGAAQSVELADFSLRTAKPTFIPARSAAGKKLSFLSTLSYVRKLKNIAQHIVKAEKIIKTYQARIGKARLVIVGGGQLLQDNDLSFPFKLYCLSKAVKRSGAELVIFSIGVGSCWSVLARKLVNNALQSASSISVRDDDSLRNLETFVTARCPKSIVPDPALFSADVYATGRFAPSKSKFKRIGLGVMAASSINRSSSADGKNITEPDILNFWRELYIALTTAGHQPVFFTNGNLKDRWSTEAVIAAISKTQDAAHAPDSFFPETPRDLVDFISTIDVVIAFRLHAIIIGTSLGKEILPLFWDRKTAGFLKNVGCTSAPLSIKNSGDLNLIQSISTERFTYAVSNVDDCKSEIKALARKLLLSHAI